MTLNLDVRL